MQGELDQYFSTPDLTGLIQQLKHLSLFSADALVVEAEQGAGKSSFIQHLQQSIESSKLEASVDFVRVEMEPESEAFDLLFELAEKLGLQVDHNSASETLNQLRSYSASLHSERKVVLLVVDDAHFIADEALGAILSLLQPSDEQGFGICVLFFSEPGLKQRVQSIGSSELSVSDFELEPFSTQELERFLSARIADFDSLHEAGKLPSIAAIWNRSGGRPGPALEFIESFLGESSGKAFVESARAIPMVHLGILTLLVAGLIFTLLYRGSEESNLEQASDVKVADLPIQPEASISAGPADPKPVIIKQEAPDESPSLSEVNSSEPELLKLTADQNPANTLVVDTSTVGNDDLSESGNDIVVSEHAPSDAELEPVPDQVQRNPAEDLASLTEPGVGVDANGVLSSSPLTELSDSENMLLQQDSDAFVLQLVAASKKDSLLGYIQEQPNREALHLYRRVKGQDGQWYIVVIGPYKSKKEAENARSGLPSNQREAGPWPKSIREVQREIAAFRDR